MGKQEAVLRYKAAMSVFKKWFADRIINEKELLEIDTIISKKYGLSLASIYRQNA